MAIVVSRSAGRSSSGSRGKDLLVVSFSLAFIGLVLGAGFYLYRQASPQEQTTPFKDKNLGEIKKSGGVPALVDRCKKATLSHKSTSGGGTEYTLSYVGEKGEIWAFLPLSSVTNFSEVQNALYASVKPLKTQGKASSSFTVNTKPEAIEVAIYPEGLNTPTAKIGTFRIDL